MSYTPKHVKKSTPALRILNLASIFFGCLMVLGVGMVLFNTLRSKSEQDAFRDLAALAAAQTGPGGQRDGASASGGAASGGSHSGPGGSGPSTGGPASSGSAASGEGGPEASEPWQSPYQILYEQNRDFTAWLKVPGTRIDYPVMYTPEDTEHYIYRAFDGSHSPSGTPFVGDYGSLEERRCVIYGHNMNNGSMFHDLMKYQKKDFWQESPTFTVTTLTEAREYEIFAVVQTRLLHPQESGLRYYRLEDGVEQWLCQQSLYDTGIVPEEGDSVVLLSTCSYHTEDGRLVVAGRLKKS